MAEKKTERMTLWMPESLKVDLMHLAADDNRAFGEYMVLVLSRHAYGYSRMTREVCDVANSGDARHE